MWSLISIYRALVNNSFNTSISFNTWEFFGRIGDLKIMKGTRAPRMPVWVQVASPTSKRTAERGSRAARVEIPIIPGRQSVESLEEPAKMAPIAEARRQGDFADVQRTIPQQSACFAHLFLVDGVGERDPGGHPEYPSEIVRIEPQIARNLGGANPVGAMRADIGMRTTRDAFGGVGETRLDGSPRLQKQQGKKSRLLFGRKIPGFLFVEKPMKHLHHPLGTLEPDRLRNRRARVPPPSLW